MMDSDGVFEVDTNSLWSVILENVYVFFGIARAMNPLKAS